LVEKASSKLNMYMYSYYHTFSAAVMGIHLVMMSLTSILMTLSPKYRTATVRTKLGELPVKASV